MAGILGRRTGKRSTVANLKPRAPRPPKPVEVTPPTLDPMEAWKSFKRNALLHARHFLDHGELHAGCHHVIQDVLGPWIVAVKAGGPEVRDALLEMVPSIPTPDPAPTRSWVMPADRRARGSVSEIDDPSQIRSALRLAFEGVEEPEIRIPVSLAGEATFEAVSGADPSKSAVLKFAVAKRAQIDDETPLIPRIVETPDHRGYGSAFNADWWGDPPKLPKHPKHPEKPLTGAAWDRWGRQLIAAIKARTSPPLLRLDEALAALDMKRRPKWLPVGRQDGEEWVEREVVRAHLLFGLPQTKSTEVLAAWPIKVPRCRYCGRLSIYGWADMICERCEKTRSQIENRGITVLHRRGWHGPSTIGDDALLLEIQHRLWRQDHQELKELQKASGVWAKRVADAREHDTAQPVVEEPEFAEAAE